MLTVNVTGTSALLTWQRERDKDKKVRGKGRRGREHCVKDRKLGWKYFV